MPLFQNAQVLSAVQSAIVTDVSGAWVDVTGVSINLTPGTWIVMANAVPRLWQSGVAYTKGVAQMRIVDSGVTIVYGLTQNSIDVQNEQANPQPLSFMFVLTVTAPTTIKMQGAFQILTGGANFASGFRWDSGYGQPATMWATKVVGL